MNRRAPKQCSETSKSGLESYLRTAKVVEQTAQQSRGALYTKYVKKQRA